MDWVESKFIWGLRPEFAEVFVLPDRTPAEFAATCSGEKDGDETALEDAARLPLSHRTTAPRGGRNKDSSTLLLEALT